jgi:hypothetical protein
MLEKLYNIELTESQVKCLYKAMQYARLDYYTKNYLGTELIELNNLAACIEMQTIEGSEI